MMPNVLGQQVTEALAQVRSLQQVVLDRLRFHGFSGPTRAISGTLAMVAALVMSTPWYPRNTEAHLVGWGCVLAASLALNGGALIYWFLTDVRAQRDFRRLDPVLDIIPPLVVGALITVALILRGMHDYLFGIWMLMFGLTNLSTRYVLPRTVLVVGLFYVLCGAAWLLAPQVSFLNPWPMGMVFFAGEWVGGLILYFDGHRLNRPRLSTDPTKEYEYAEPDGNESVRGAEQDLP